MLKTRLCQIAFSLVRPGQGLMKPQCRASTDETVRTRQGPGRRHQWNVDRHFDKPNCLGIILRRTKPTGLLGSDPRYLAVLSHPVFADLRRVHPQRDCPSVEEHILQPLARRGMVSRLDLVGDGKEGGGGGGGGRREEKACMASRFRRCTQ
ncbi:hypothetical protein M433DRAFT_358516 [Acidomyces richmondensis BFW]|nr:MAG: hypothetical protein FE78DRAFT_494334 [Acidomyces sp. 'richmondensis']KYG43406.1 hypothetical protein M433DRAFT_358516 [Acidomyces richmondensis BFW]